MLNLKEVLEAMFKGAAIQGAQISGINTNQLIPIYLEYIAFQIYQLAPLEFEQWLPLVLEQCKQPTTPMLALKQAREDLTLTLEMVTNA